MQRCSPTHGLPLTSCDSYMGMIQSTYPGKLIFRILSLGSASHRPKLYCEYTVLATEQLYGVSVVSRKGAAGYSLFLYFAIPMQIHDQKVAFSFNQLRFCSEIPEVRVNLVSMSQYSSRPIYT